MSDFPLKTTPNAAEKLVNAIASDPDVNDGKHFVRASVVGGGCAGYKNTLDFDDSFDPEDDVRTTLEFDGKKVDLVTDSFSRLYLEGITLDYVSEQFEEGFKFVGGQQKRTCGCGASVSY